MVKTTLSTQDKQDKKLRENLRGLHIRIKNDFSFHKIKTWEDLRAITPIPDTKSGPLIFSDLKVFLENQTFELEERIKKSHERTNDIREQGISGNASEIPSSAIPSQHGSNNTVQHTISAPQVSVHRPDLATSPPAIQSKHPVSVVLDAIEQVDEKEKDYGFKRSPNEKVDHLWFQKKAIVQILKMIHEKRTGILIVSSTGTGKTFMALGTMRRLVDEGYETNKTMSHIPYLYVTRATIVEQTERVSKEKYNLTVADREIINIEQLRSKAGRLWVTEKMTVEEGKEVYSWVWKPIINPCVVMWDECQALKNEGSTQHNIASALNDIKGALYPPVQLFISATPFMRVSEAKCFAVSTHRDISHLGFPPGTKLSNANWPAYAAAIAGDSSSPEDYNESAVERLMEDLKDYIVHVKGVRSQFNAKNGIKLIEFETDEERKQYREAYDRYVKEQERLKSLQVAGSKSAGAGILVEFLKYRMSAELIRAKRLAQEGYDAVNKRGKAAVFALGFKGTIIKMVKELIRLGVPRDKISLIWGGGQTQLTKKQEAKKKLIEMKDKLEGMGVTLEEMLKDLDLDKVEDRLIEELDPSLRLGVQTPEERQKEIDNFNSGKTLYCLFTFRAGGVGLSLHHTDELTKEKVIRKESGYAVEEDIPYIPVRPRESFLSPTYSAIELVQGLGRAPRITSLSDTIQTLIFYKGTIEEDVAMIVSKKLRCLSKVVKQHESWESVVIGNPIRRAEEVRRHVELVPEEDSGETTMVGTGEDE